jgi:plastocyanin
VVTVAAVAIPASAGSAVRAPRSAIVGVLDNAFHRGTDRPSIHLRPGGVVTWRWRGRESHQVVAGGPQRFRSPTRNRGSFSVRLRRSGTYRVVCAIHAPGMRMTIVVR